MKFFKHFKKMNKERDNGVEIDCGSRLGRLAEESKGGKIGTTVIE